MKTLLKNRIILLIIISFPAIGGLGGCKDDDHKDPIDQLPPATQTGAGTFAALVDGKPFIDKSGGWFNCFYQFVEGDYYFGIQGIDDRYKYTSNPWGLDFGTIKRTISEGEVLELLEPSDGNASGGGFVGRKHF